MVAWPETARERRKFRRWRQERAQYGGTSHAAQRRMPEPDAALEAEGPALLHHGIVPDGPALFLVTIATATPPLLVGAVVAIRRVVKQVYRIHLFSAAAELTDQLSAQLRYPASRSDPDGDALKAVTLLAVHGPRLARSGTVHFTGKHC
jgi:hypothetical protein